MTKVTIFGAGITGMAIASQLPRSYDITIVARDLPGDDRSQDWASPWANAGWVALGGSPAEERMQLDALAFFLKLAIAYPESSVHQTEITDLHEVGATTAEELWYRDRIPGFQKLEPHKILGGEKTVLAVKYSSFTLDPSTFLPWMRTHLESTSVKFKRISTVKSLGELAHLGHDVLVNASGLASQTLSDVQDENLIMDRHYTILLKLDYKNSFVRRSGNEYTYGFGRSDGSLCLGGESDAVHDQLKSKESIRVELLRRAHLTLPEVFPSTNPDDYTIVDDLAGVRPIRLPSARLEKEIINGQKVVHAYGPPAGGYIFSFGLGREVAQLVNEYAFKV
ncbi:D-amino-acid oxidase-like protein [Cladobotryum mycophilum]|uniref:D-amino-acid oxidase-like protein n=1 Tax=Cladobotryum mycophilum TaxID=491253 RepID=A0ABR0SZN9_9HYPO